MSKTTPKTAILVASAIAMATTLGMAGSSSTANAAEMEKCFGVAKAGKNDCASGGSCAGTAKKNGSSKHFVAVPKGTCDKLVGGSLKSM